MATFGNAMTRRNYTPSLILSAIVLALLGILIATQRRVWVQSSTPPPRAETAEASGKISPALKRLTAFGYSKLLADWTWLRAIQYYGSNDNIKDHYHGLGPLLEETTDLDPNFEYVYQFAGQSLPFHDGTSKLWYNVNATIELLKKGIAAAPTRWQIPWLLGFTLYTYRGDYAAAGHAMEQASKLPGVPSYAGSLAARLLVEGNDLDTAIYITQSALTGADDDRARDELTLRLKSLMLQRDLKMLNAAADERRHTEPVHALSDLVGYAGLTSIPEDPFGGAYELDASVGNVTSTHQDKIIHLFIHPNSPALEQTAD
jgi:tetratricopeptide (TPR) repeat protein